ncbi:TrbI/VirB10 family protein [Microcoleus sp. K1-B6]|uniref:hypothetical protein n=1 Tax=unclassified Microcoleus TaxID=2642155 RepID=UPI002FD5F7D7
MSEKELQNGHEFDGEPDEIEEVSYNTPPNSTTSHPFNGNNSSNEANNFSHSFNGNNSSNEANNFSHSSNSFQAANAPDGAGSNGKKTFGLRSVEPLSREEERELAGHDGETDELLTSEHRIKQDNEGAETHPVSEKPEVRTFSVLMGTGAVLGILGFFWFVFFAPKPVRQQAKTTNPKPVQVSEDESGELKSRLAFQDQQRALEVQPPEPKNRSTPAPKPMPAPKPAPAARRSQPPRPVQNFNPPPRTVQTIPPPQPPLPRPAQQPAPPPPRPYLTPLPRPVPPPAPLALRPVPPPEKVDPYERWAQLASLGQSRGQEIKELNGQGIAASSAIFPIAPGITATSYPAVRSVMPVTTPPPSTVAIAPTAAQATLPSTVAIAPTAAQATIPSTVAIAPVPLPQQQSVPPISQNPQPVLVSSPKSPQSSAPMQEIPAIAIGVTDSAANANRMTPGEAGILNRTTAGENTEGSTAMREIAIGSSAQAKVIVPMIWDEAGQSPTAGRFAVQLTEDIMATDGAIALPSGTVLITQVENVTRGNRLVSQSVVALVYPDAAGRIQQVPIPPGNLIVRGTDNQPLIADSLFDRGSEIAKADILVGILGSLGRVGEIINRPAQETFSQQSGFFGSTAVKTTTSPEPNILAAALEGFFTPTAQRLRERSDRDAQELLKRGNVAIVPEGTQVSVFVNAFVTVQR